MSSRDTYHHGDLKRALVDAAIEIIREQGAEAFTLREAARRVGVNHRAAYRHFDDKTTLLAAVAEQGYQSLVERMRAERDKVAPDIRAELFALARAYVCFAMAQPAHFRVMFGPRLNEDGRFPELEKSVRSAFALLMSTLQRGQAAGLLKPELDRDAVISLWSSIHGLASLVLMRRVPVKPKLLPSYTDKVLTPTISGLFR